MATRHHTDSQTKDPIRDEVERYRRAAEETLNQLDWCISYLHQIRKPDLARALVRNRSTIRRRMGGFDG
jgi:hypothetical protein